MPHWGRSGSPSMAERRSVRVCVCVQQRIQEPAPLSLQYQSRLGHSCSQELPLPRPVEGANRTLSHTSLFTRRPPQLLAAGGQSQCSPAFKMSHEPIILLRFRHLFNVFLFFMSFISFSNFLRFCFFVSTCRLLPACPRPRRRVSIHRVYLAVCALCTSTRNDDVLFFSLAQRSIVGSKSANWKAAREKRNKKQ